MYYEYPKCSLSNNLLYFQEFGHQEDILGVAYTPPHFLATSSYDGMVGCLFFFYFIASADVWFIPGDKHEQNKLLHFVVRYAENVSPESTARTLNNFHGLCFTLFSMLVALYR